MLGLMEKLKSGKRKRPRECTAESWRDHGEKGAEELILRYAPELGLTAGQQDGLTLSDYCSQRRVRGQSDWLSFLCKILSFSVSSQFILALSSTHLNREIMGNFP